MSDENILAYAVKQKEIDYNAKDLILLQAQLINKNEKLLMQQFSSHG